MRKISIWQILLFSSLFFLALACAIFSTDFLLGKVPSSDFRGIILFLFGLLIFYLYAIAIYRVFCKICPIKPGYIEINSKEEFGYHVYLLFYLILFYPIMRSGFVPVPLMRVFYLMLGAKLGSNTFSSGIILDPPFVSIGDNTLIGQYALIVPHVIENGKLAHFPIVIGDNVTVGAQSVVLSSVTIGDGAIVATGAVVSKGTVIGAGEIWGGIPARLLKKVSSN
jgi:hypothetical protein